MSNRLDYFKKINSRTWLNNPNSGVIETPPPEKSFMDTVTDVAENVTNGIDNNIRWVSNKLHKDDVDYSSTGKDYLSGTNSYNASDTTTNTFPGNGEINNDKLSNHTIEVPEKIKQFFKTSEKIKSIYDMSPIGLLGGLAYQATALDKSLSNKIIQDGKNYVNESTEPTWLNNFQKNNLNALENTQEYNYNVPKAFINGVSNVYGGISDLFGLDSGNELNYVREKTSPNKSFSGKIFSKEFFTDPEGLTYTLPNAVGSMVALAPSTYLAPSYLIKLIQSTSNPMIKQAAELALRGAMTAFPESMAEGGSVVRESKENNLNNPYLRGWATTMSNLPMLMASNAAEYTLLGGKGINPLYGKTLPNRLAKATMATGANAVQNGAEEFIQQGIQNKWTDKDYSFNPLNAPQDQIDAMQTGIIVGGGISAAPSVISATTGNPDFDKYINNASKETNVPADIIKEVGNAESSDNPNAVSNQGAVGYMQLMPSTAEAMGVKDLTDPEQNIMGGAKYLKYLYDKYGNWKDTLIAYNEGEGNFDNGKRFSESIEYANKILDNIDNENIINLPDKKYYNILDEVSDTGLTSLTEQKLNLLARDFYNKFGYNLDVTSMKRNGDGSSWHDSGQAIDVANDLLANNSEARTWLIKQGEKYGLTSLDEYTNPSANATGGHIHFSDHGDPLPGISEKNTSTPSPSNNTDYTINNDFSNMQADDITLYEPAKVNKKTGQNDTSNLENLSEDEKWDILDEEIEKATNSDIDYLDKLTKIKVNKDIPALDNLINKIRTTDKKFLTKIQAKRGKTFTEEQKSQIDLATKELEQLYSENKFLEAMKKAEDIEYMKKGFVADNTFKTNTTIKPKADTNKVKTLGYDLLKQLQKRNIELSNTNNVVNYDKIKSALASNDINKQKDALTVMQYILNLLKNDKKTISPSTLSNDNIPIKDISTTGIIQQEPKEIDIESAKNIGKILYNKVQEKQLKVDLNNLEKDIRSNDIKKINKANNFMQKKLDKTLSNEEKQQIKKETLISSNSAVDVATITDDSTVRLSQGSNNVGATKEWRPASVKSNVSSTNIISNDNINNSISDNDIYNNTEQKISSFNLANGYKTESGKTLAKANANEFIIKPNGSMDFGEITEIISKATGGELLPGKIRLRVGNEKQGLIHAKKHEKQAKHIGYNSIEDMISDVANNFDVIYKKDNEEGKRATYSLVKLNNNDVKAKQNVVPTYFELQNEDNGYYIIITAIPKNIGSFKNQIKKETLIYSKQGQDIATISSDSAVRLSQSNNKTGVTEERLPISVKSNVSSNNIIPNDNISDNQNESEVNENELNDSSNPMASRDKQGYNKNNVGTDDESHRSSREDGRDIRTNSEDGSRQDSSTSIRRDSTNSGGKTSNSTIRQEKSSNLDNSTRDTKLSRSITDSYERPLANETTAKTITQPANESSINERNLNKQKQVNNQNIKVGNLESIKNDLPLLLPEQQDDVFKTETRMFVNNKPGMLFTNGTGTGKTFTGLGIIKRFTNMGKNNILIVSPGTGINSSWIESGKKFFNLNIVPLKNKKDNGGNNIVITTLNNFTSNKTLVKRAWDLIIIDESHKLISNQNNKETGAIKNLRAITLHDRGFSTRFDNLYDEEFEKIHHLEESLKKDKNTITKSEETAIKEQITELKGNLSNIREQDYKKWERIDEKDKPKVLFLSATPFSHVKNIDYAEGYLFKYDKKEDNGGYGQPTAQEDFLIQNFGYRMRYGRLEQPDADVDNSIMEINFCEKLKKDGALSNRRLIIDKDYDRGFILIDGGIGKKVDEGFEYLFNSKNNYQLLANFLNKNYDYYSKLFLLEAIKARESIKLIKEYQKTGKKIVVFHRYLKNESKHPFKLFFTDEQEKSMTPTTKRRLENEYERFCKERPDLVNLDLSELTSPIQTLQNAFGNKIAIYNGKLSAKEKDINLAKFNDDNSNVNIILVQADAGCAGISLHDKTGKHQRVLINLGLPTKPVEAIQTEGRIYRVGQKTNAIFRYLNTGTTMERTAFATNIAQRSETVENLALGEEARNLKQSFVEAFQDTINSDEWKKNLPGNANEGTGGKEKDYTNIGNRTDFDKAKAFYFANQKKNSSNKSAEGKDYFSTPEPLGLKMVEWSGLKDGESALEPSAGHGAVARWFPATTKNIAIEPSGQLADLTQMNFNGKVKNIPFEDFSIINKFDVITMNPPFGKGGKTAIEHIAKAFKHLYDGGRIVAIIPDGPACQKHFNNWFDSEGASSAILIKEVILPSIAFKRAGTSVGTKVVIIDKQTTDKGKSAVQINKTTPIDLSNITNINEFFNAIKDIQIPDKLNPNKIPNLQNQTFSNTDSTNIQSNSTPDNLSNNIAEETISINSNTTPNNANIIEENNDFVNDIYRGLGLYQEIPENPVLVKQIKNKLKHQANKNAAVKYLNNSRTSAYWDNNSNNYIFTIKNPLIVNLTAKYESKELEQKFNELAKKHNVQDINIDYGSSNGEFYNIFSRIHSLNYCKYSFANINDILSFATDVSEFYNIFLDEKYVMKKMPPNKTFVYITPKSGIIEHLSRNEINKTAEKYNSDTKILNDIRRIRGDSYSFNDEKDAQDFIDDLKTRAKEDPFTIEQENNKFKVSIRNRFSFRNIYMNAKKNSIMKIIIAKHGGTYRNSNDQNLVGKNVDYYFNTKQDAEKFIAEAKNIINNKEFISMEDIKKQSFDKKEEIKLDLAKHYLHIKDNGDTITIFIKVPLSNKIYTNYMAPALYKKDKYHYKAERLRNNTTSIIFENHQEAYELINEIEANIRKAKNEATNNTKTKKNTKYSGMGQMIPSLIDIDSLVTPDKLNSFEKGLSDFGTAIGCPILFFNNKKAKNIRGAFSGGIMYFNRASNISPRWTFYHEFIHWLKSTNPEVFKEIRIAIGDITATSILDYREQIVGGNDTFDGKPLLTDEDIIEEMIADHMFNTSTRISLNRLMAKNNPTLWQRFVAFWQNLLDRFRAIYSIPLGLDKTQGENMNRAMEKLVTSIKDKDGKVLFKRTKQGLVFAKDDMPVVNNKEIKINPTSVQPLSSNTTKLSAMKKSSILYSLKRWWNNKWQGKPSKATNEQIKHHLELITNCKFEFGRLDNIYKEQGYIVHEYPPNNNLKKALGTIERIIRVDKAFNYAKMLEATAPIIAKDLGFTDQAMNDYIATWLFSRDEAQKDDIKFKKVNNAIKQKEQEDIQGELYAKNLIELQNLFHYFDEMTAKEAFKDSLYNKENSAKSGLKSKKDKIHDQFFDRYGPIQRLVNDYEKRTGKTLEYINPYEQFRLTAGSAGRGMTFLEGKGNEAKQALAEVYKTIDFTKFKTLNSILKDNNIDKSISDMEDFANYCIAMHEKEVLEYNKKVNSKEQIDVQHKPEHIEEIINNATDNIKQAHKELLQYQHTLMEVMRDGGLINRKQLQEIESKWKYYVPLYKFFDENEDIQFEHLKLERNDKVKKLNENAHRLTINPLEGIIVNTYKILKLAEKNKAKAYLTALLHQTGINEYIPELEVAKEGTSLKNSYSVYINGKKRTYTTTPEIVKAMADVTLGNKNLFGKIFQTMSTWIRATSTFLNPLFSVANGMRDVATTWLYSKYGFKVTDFTSGLTASIFKNKYYWEYMASGAAQSALVSLDRNYTQASLNKIYRKTKPKWKQWIPTLEQLKNALQYVSEISEDTFRIAHYRAGKRYMEKQSQKNNDTNINISKVAYETRDIMDFSRYGASGKEWNDWAAFSNAALQGWSKTFRTLEHAKKDKQFRIKFLFKLGLLSLLALSLALWNSSDDDRRKKYNEIPQRIKDTHYIFIVGDTIFRIPKGLDPMIILISGLIERGIDYVYDKNKSFLDFSKDTTLDMAKMLWGQIPGFLPTASTPIIEVLANRSFYFDMPIVPPAKENDMPRMQYDDYTSTASKFLGKEFNISPKKFEHILYSYTGYLGRTVNKTIDILADKNHSIQEKWQSTPLSEMAPTSRFLYTPYKSSASITKFYEDLKMQKALYKEYKENGIRPKEFNEGYYKKLIEAEKQMRKLSKKKQDILKNKSTPLTSRQSSFNSLNNQKLSIARRTLQYK